MADQGRIAVASLVAVGCVLLAVGCGSSQPPGPPARSAAAAGGLGALGARYLALAQSARATAARYQLN